MKRRTNRITIPKFNPEKIKENWKLIVLTSIFTAGMISGALVLKSDSEGVITAKLIEIASSYKAQRDMQSLLMTFFSSFLTSTAFLLSAFIFGLCALGVPFVLIIPYARGIGLGMLSGYLYISYGLKGMAYSLIILMPSAVLSVATILFACNESLMMSTDIFSSLIQRRPPSAENSIIMYALRYALILLLIFVSALIDAFLTKAFSSFFVF